MKRRTFLNLDRLEDRALLSQSGLSFSLATNQSTYNPGQPVVMTFTETNTTSHQINVTDGPSLDGFDVSQNGKVIWRSNAGPNPLYLRLVPLAPGQSLTLTATWNGVPTGGSSPISGSFSVWNQHDPSLTTTVSIASSPTSPTPVSPVPPNGQPVGITNPGPLPVSPSSGGAPVGSPTSPAGGGSSSTPGSGSVTGVGSTPIVVSVATNQPIYQSGQHVRMTVSVQNTGNGDASGAAGSSSGVTLFDGSTPIWHRSSIVNRRALHRLKLGQPVTLSAVWNGRVHHTPAAIAAGTYTLLANIGGASGSTTFQVA